MNQQTQTPIPNATDKETHRGLTLHLVEMSRRMSHETVKSDNYYTA